MAEESIVVEMLVQTAYMHGGNLYRFHPGMMVSVPPALAKSWAGAGIAKEATGAKPRRAAAGTEEAGHAPVELGDHHSMQAAETAFQARSAPRQEVLRQDLRIAALHGDVQAARHLDVLGPGGAPQEGAPVTLTNEGAPEQAPAPADGDRTSGDQMPQPVSPEARAARAEARTSTGASARSALGGGGRG